MALRHSLRRWLQLVAQRRPVLIGLLVAAAGAATAVAFLVPPLPDARWRVGEATVALAEGDLAARIEAAGAAAPVALPEPVALPDSWTRTRPGFGGTAFYRLSVTLGADATAPRALFIPRVSNSSRVAINGERVHADNPDEHEGVIKWSRPLLIEVPPRLLHAGSNLVTIAVTGRNGTRAGLSEVYFGPREELATAHRLRAFLQIDLPPLTSLAVMALALPLLLIFARDPRNSAGYGLFAAGSMLFALRNLHPQVTTLPLPVAYWQPLVSATLGWAVIPYCLFLLRDAGWRRPRMERAMLAFAVIGTAVVFLLPLSQFLSLVRWLWYLPLFAIGLASMAVYAVRTFAAPTPHRLLVLLGIAALPGPALHDLLWQNGAGPFASVLWLPLLFPLMLVMTGVVLADEVARARVALGSMNKTLEGRVTAARMELEHAYERRRASERAAISAQERLRLMRDMHDGVGTRLSLLLSGLQRGQVSPDSVADGVRDALEELHLLIDAQSPSTTTLLDAVANLRHRLEPRLASLGVATGWRIDAAAQDVSLSPQATLYVLRILQECVANAVRHGRARTVTFAMTIEPGRAADDPRPAVAVAIIDDGVGLARAPAETKGGGRGLANARARAAAMGGRFEIESHAGGTTARLVVPLPEPEAASGDDAEAGPRRERAEADLPTPAEPEKTA